MKKRFALRECGRGPVVYGLESVSLDNAIIGSLAYNKPINTLKVGEFATGNRNGYSYEVVRVQDAEDK